MARVQWHMLLCQWHTTENAAEQDKFIRSCDSKLLPTGVKFFSVYPTVFTYPVTNVPVHVAIQGYEVEPDVINNSIFMLQDVKFGDGESDESLFMFFDSGCMTAGVSDRAARLLEGGACLLEGGTRLLEGGACHLEGGTRLLEGGACRLEGGTLSKAV